MTGHCPKRSLGCCRRKQVWKCLHEIQMQDSLDERGEKGIRNHRARQRSPEFERWRWMRCRRIDSGACMVEGPLWGSRRKRVVSSTRTSCGGGRGGRKGKGEKGERDLRRSRE